MRISIIAAMGKNRVIGMGNTLPWRLPSDMKHFVSLTMHKPIIVGRMTFASFGNKPLKNRKNIVLTQNRHWSAENVLVAHSPEQALQFAQPAEEVMVIGGSAVYNKFLPMADRLYLTYINAEFEGDSYFPDFSCFEFTEIEREDHPSNPNDPFPFSFVTLDKPSHHKMGCQA